MRRRSIGPSEPVDNRVLAGRPTTLVDNESQTESPFATNKTKVPLPRNIQLCALDKENSTTAMSAATAGTKQHLMTTNNHDAFDTDEVNAAFQLLALKSKPKEKTVRFDDTVQVCEFKRCFGHACLEPTTALGPKPPMKYALALDWTLTAEYTTRLNTTQSEQDVTLGNLTSLPLEERCRLLAQHMGVQELAQDVAQQRGRTTNRVTLAIEKQLTDFMAGKAAKPP